MIYNNINYNIILEGDFYVRKFNKRLQRNF